MQDSPSINIMKLICTFKKESYFEQIAWSEFVMFNTRYMLNNVEHIVQSF